MQTECIACELGLLKELHLFTFVQYTLLSIR